MPDSFFVQLGTNDLLNLWIETNNVQEGGIIGGGESGACNIGGAHVLYLNLHK